MVLRPKGLQALKRVAKTVGLTRTGADLNLDAGCDSTPNRQGLFNAAIHALRTRGDRTFAWEDTFKRLLRRFEHLQPRHFGMQLLAYTLINVREFCGA
jgi:transposase